MAELDKLIEEAADLDGPDVPKSLRAENLKKSDIPRPNSPVRLVRLAGNNPLKVCGFQLKEYGPGLSAEHLAESLWCLARAKLELDPNVKNQELLRVARDALAIYRTVPK